MSPAARELAPGFPPASRPWKTLRPRQPQIRRPSAGSASNYGPRGSTGVLASLDRPFIIEQPDELRGLTTALAGRLAASAHTSPPHP